MILSSIKRQQSEVIPDHSRTVEIHDLCITDTFFAASACPVLTLASML